MKHTIVTFLIASFFVCSICSCKNKKPVNMKTEDEIYSVIEKRLDSFINQSVSVLSIDRIKKMANKINQIGTSEELVLDTLPDDSKISFKRVDGKLEFYINDAISTAQLYSINAKESISGAVVALEIFEKVRQRNCDHWREVCNRPEKTIDPAREFRCDLEIKFWCN